MRVGAKRRISRGCKNRERNNTGVYYLTGFGEDEAEKKFLKDLKELDFWEEDEEEEEEETIDDELLQKTVKTLTGELRRDWKREDFMNSNKDCDANVYFIVTEFSLYLHQEKSFEWVTGDLFSEVVVEYFSTVSRGKRGFYFTFSQEWLEEFIGSYFDILSLNDAKGMAVLKAVEYFTRFLHKKGIYRDKELKKVDSAIEEFSVPLMVIYEGQAWKYGFLDGWGMIDEERENMHKTWYISV
ncbi:hypothetical protein C5S36_07200 [Candidatus Methanophagaceae archaeon]|nr:hypothetical protein C5S36_07200 [Methanophagales archaeon]